MAKLNKQYEVPILKALDHPAGMLTGAIARSFTSPLGRTVRQHSGDVRAWLLDMEAHGLVKQLDDKKPTCWCATKAGRAALQEAGNA